jgi:hypothetical protein
MKSDLEKLTEHHSVDAETGCWNWTRTVSDGGYGRISRTGRYDLAHRVAFEVFVGSIPSGMLVCHKCDNRRCINPEHLFLGDHKDNASDMVQKGRSLRGEKHHNAKLTAEQAAAIRADARKYREIAVDYGVTYGLIGHIKQQRAWRV